MHTQSMWLATAFREDINTVYVIRGPSGCGKSLLATRLADMFTADISRMRPVICTADGYFMRTGEYKFDPKLLGEAHADCLSRFVQAVKERKHRIILANTSTRYWEYCNYTAISEMVGYTTVVADMVPATVKEIKLCADRNVHGVDAATVAAQTLRFTPDPRATRVCIETEL